MKWLTKTRLLKIALIVLATVGNILFYTWGYPESGAKYAWDTHPLFAVMCQFLFLAPISAYVYFTKEDV